MVCSYCMQRRSPLKPPATQPCLGSGSGPFVNYRNTLTRPFHYIAQPCHLPPFPIFAPAHGPPLVFVPYFVYHTASSRCVPSVPPRRVQLQEPQTFQPYFRLALPHSSELPVARLCAAGLSSSSPKLLARCPHPPSSITDRVAMASQLFGDAAYALISTHRPEDQAGVCSLFANANLSFLLYRASGRRQ